MKALKLVALSLLLYVGLVIAFESMLGYFQPGGQGTVVITTTDEEGASHDRVLSLLESDGQLFVAANHWPRAWYRQALANPRVQVTIDGVRGDYVAVPATDAEHERVDNDHSLGPVIRVLTGFHVPKRRMRRSALG